MKRELELYLQHCSNINAVLERAKNDLFKLQPNRMSHQELGLFADILLGLSNLQVEVNAAAFDARHGQAKGEA